MHEEDEMDKILICRIILHSLYFVKKLKVRDGVSLVLATLLDVFSVGLVEYSDDPRTEWHLNAHPSKASLLEAIANLPYKGGSTMTGIFLNSTTDQSLLRLN